MLGNIWLLFAVVIYLGGKVARTSPTMLSFFGVGRWLYPGTYNLIVICCVILGVGFLIAASRARAER